MTAGTLHKLRLFNSPAKLDAIMMRLFNSAKEFGWQLRAWAILSNHYHFLADSPEGTGETLRIWLREFHRTSAIAMNQLDATPGRRVWFNFRESQITHQISLLARLRYVNENPAHHGLVPVAHRYPWCSAAWFETNAPESFVKSVARFRTDRLKVWDDFD